MKKIKYKITNGMGDYEMGAIIDAFIMADDYGDGDKVLVYHPKSKRGTCASIEFCKLDRRSNKYVSLHKDAWINLSSRYEKLFISIYNKNNDLNESIEKLSKIKKILCE